MSSQHSSQYTDATQRGDRRPTLPPIREVLGAELAQPVVPLHQRHSHAGSSPHIPLSGLSITEDAPYTYGSSGRNQHLHPGYAYGPRSGSPAPSARGPSDATYRQPQQGHPSYGHPSAIARHIDPNALATSGYPYAVSQPQYQAPQLSGSSSGAGRSNQELAAAERSSAAGRYECNWPGCGKGFTRPSSLKIHWHSHTGEKPHVCPYEGCGRRFSVQSNMRRHARVHTRTADSQPVEDVDEDEEESEPTTASRSASHSRGNSGSSASHSSRA